MLLFPPRSSGILALLATGLLAGCAATDQAKPPGMTTRAAVPLALQAHAPPEAPAFTPKTLLTRNAVPPVPQDRAPASVQLAAYTRDTFQPELRSQPAAPTPLLPTEVVPAPLSGQLDIGRQSLPLDLPTALAMTQGQNPRVAFAQAQIAQSLAQHQAARVLWLPSIRAGMNYNKHEGRLQDVVGNSINTSRGAAFGGLGAGAVGAGSPAIPGLYAAFHTTDAIYQRQITNFALQARQYQGTAAANDQLLETALAYVVLLDGVQRRAIAAETLHNGESLAELTANFASSGAGNLADADRATAALALLRNEAARTDEAIAVASARLAQQLSLDPSLVIEPQEPALVPIELVPLDTAPADLVATALTNRPDLAASRSLVCEAVNRLRREEHAPWLPSVLLGVSYGQFAAGTGGQITNPGDRFDFDGFAWWEVRNLGFGEVAARDNARAQIQQARMREVETLDLAAREVVEAHAQAVSRKRQIELARQGIAAAEQSHRRNLERIRSAQGLPIEVLQSIQALDAARRDYLRTLTDYNTAQFRLYRALGWPISL
jgi:outer membrane protein TolC